MGRKFARRAAVLALASTLVGCSYVPDAVNPVEWYKGVTGWFGDEVELAELQAPATTQPAPGADQSYPSLSTVPERPAVRAPAERQRIAQGLVADREGAKYTDQVLTRGPTRARQPRVAAAAAPAPPPTKRATAPLPKKRATAPLPKKRATAQLPRKRATTPPPPPTAARRAAPPRLPSAPPPAARVAAVAPPPPPTSDVRRVYESRLAESQATVTTRPVGPTNIAEIVRRPPPPAPQPAKPAPVPAREVAERPEAASAPAVAPRTGAAAAAPKPAGPRSLDEFDPYAAAVSYQVASIYFNHGSAGLNAHDRGVLRGVARLHREQGGTMRVIGHASSRTVNMEPVKHQVANFRISVDRANVVVRELVRLSIDPSDIFVGAVSNAEPIYYEVMPAGEAGNRRTEIYVDY